jgi:chorismate mutase
VNSVEKTPKYFLVEATALPEVFLKVAEAKRMLETGEVSTVGEATAAMGISRSAYYKYRDALMPFQNLMAGRIITFQLLLKDRTGVLSGILSILAYCGANILTINQTIPTNGCAMVTMSSETSDLRCSVEELMKRIGNLDGVVKAEVVAG